jgi:hypothetical protein
MENGKAASENARPSGIGGGGLWHADQNIAKGKVIAVTGGYWSAETY